MDTRTHDTPARAVTPATSPGRSPDLVMRAVVWTHAGQHIGILQLAQGRLSLLGHPLARFDVPLAEVTDVRLPRAYVVGRRGGRLALRVAGKRHHFTGLIPFEIERGDAWIDDVLRDSRQGIDSGLTDDIELLMAPYSVASALTSPLELAKEVLSRIPEAHDPATAESDEVDPVVVRYRLIARPAERWYAALTGAPLPPEVLRPRRHARIRHLRPLLRLGLLTVGSVFALLTVVAPYMGLPLLRTLAAILVLLGLLFLADVRGIVHRIAVLFNPPRLAFEDAIMAAEDPVSWHRRVLPAALWRIASMAGVVALLAGLVFPIWQRSTEWVRVPDLETPNLSAFEETWLQGQPPAQLPDEVYAWWVERSPAPPLAAAVGGLALLLAALAVAAAISTARGNSRALWPIAIVALVGTGWAWDQATTGGILLGDPTGCTTVDIPGSWVLVEECGLTRSNPGLGLILLLVSGLLLLGAPFLHPDLLAPRQSVAP